MAKRDVQLVIRARSEADRAIDSIASALKSLSSVQDEVSGSGERTGNTLERLGKAFATLDAAYSKIDQSVAQAGAALATQQVSLAENEARFSSLTAQIKGAEQAIVSAAIAFKQDGSSEAASRLAAAQAAYRDLNAEAGKLGRALESQRGDVSQAGVAYEGLERAALAAQAAMRESGDAGERESLKIAAAAKQAEQALLDQAAAARQEVQARRNQESINQQIGVREPKSGAARASAAVFEEDARRAADALAAQERATREQEKASKEAAAALEQQRRETQELEEATASFRGRLDPTYAAQDRLNREIEEAKRLYRAGKISLHEYAQAADKLQTELDQVNAAQQRTNRNGSAEIKGVLGLRPYELQNLSFQINDVVSGLAMGQPPMQVFAQQAGQIIQIFPKALDAVLRYARGLGLLAVVLTPVLIGMGRLNEITKLQSEFDASLRLSADGARTNTESLMENVKALDEFGASTKDAGDAVKTFLSESIRPEMIDEMGESAQNLASITGKELKDAVDDVAAAFSGGYEEIAQFDNNLNFLTLTEREQIRAMFESGKASDARALAFDRFYEKTKEGAAEVETAWDRMTKAMSVSWGNLEDFLAGTTIFSDLKNEINSLMDNAAAALSLGNMSTYGRDSNGRLKDDRFANLGLSLSDVLSPRAGNAGDPLDTNSERERKLESDRRFRESRNNRNSSSRGAGSRGKTLAELQADFNREIERSNRNRQTEAEYASQTNTLAGEQLLVEQRRQAIVRAIRDAEERAARDKDKVLTLSEEQRQEIARTVGLEFDAQNAKAAEQARQITNEQRLNDLIARRAALVQRMSFQTPGSAESQGILSQIGALDSQLEGATQIAIDYWTAVAADPERMALLQTNSDQVLGIVANLQNQLSSVRAQGLQTARELAERELAELTQMQALLLEQIESAQLGGQGARVGLLTEQLAGVEERLSNAAEKAIAFWTAIAGSPEDLALLGLTPEMVDAILLRLGNVQTQAEQLRTQFLATGSQINRDLAVGAANAFDRFAQSIANGENAISSLGKAFLSFASDFLRQIAQMILQQAIFNAISGGTAGGAGGVGGFISTLFGGLFHGGGVVSGGGRSRAVASSIFNNATRYHGGGIAGIRPDEVPAILQRGEEVLTRADPRHRRNGGGAPAKNDLKIVNVMDPAQALEMALSDRAGQKVVLNFLNERGIVQR